MIISQRAARRAPRFACRRRRRLLSHALIQVIFRQATLGSDREPPAGRLRPWKAEHVGKMEHTCRVAGTALAGPSRSIGGSVRLDLLSFASALVTVIGGYLVIGCCFGLWFVARGAGRLDPAARSGSW